MSIRRVRIAPLPPPFPKADKQINNKSPKRSEDWDKEYELVVSFRYGLDEEVISKIAGLKNCDTGISMSGPEAGTRDLMFPCGPDKRLAYDAARRLWKADYFGALTIKISYPVEHDGKNSFTPWYDPHGKLIERVKHRRKALVVVTKKRKARKFRKVSAKMLVNKTV